MPEEDDEDSRKPRARRRDDDEEEPRPRRRSREDDEEDEEDDDRPRRRRRRDTGGLDSLIPYNNGMALAAYYCGVFSLIPCLWGTLSILAIVFGFLGLKRAKLHPDSKGKGHSIAGIVLGSITMLLGLACAIVGVIIAMKK